MNREFTVFQQLFAIAWFAYLSCRIVHLTKELKSSEKDLILAERCEYREKLKIEYLEKKIDELEYKELEKK